MKLRYRIFKPVYRNKKTGEHSETMNFYIEFRDHLNVRHRWPADASRDRSTELAGKITAMVNARKYGDALESEITKWLDTPAARELWGRITAADLLDTSNTARSEPLLIHLYGKADDAGNIILPGYKQELTAKGDTADHVKLTIGRIRRLLESCGFVFWNDLTKPGSTTKLLSWLGKQRESGEITGQTINYYCRAARSFGRWMTGGGNRASINLLAELKGVKNAEADKQETRALAPEEMRQLLSIVENGLPWRGFSAKDRATLYIFAYESGIRPGQIRQLRVSDFDLQSNPPTVTSAPKIVKRRRTHVQAIKPITAQRLAELFQAKMPAAAAFNMPDKFLLARMFRADLAIARENWIREAISDEERIERAKSDFLINVDRHKRRAIFYSLRHSHGTALSRAGISQKSIQASLHHARSSTTDRYLHADIDDKAKAIAALPEITMRLKTSSKAVAMWTYFIQEGKTGPIKIGKTSRRPLDRLLNIQVSSPRDMFLIGYIRGDCEASLHSKFSNCRLRPNGEWFEPSTELLGFIRENAQLMLLPMDNKPT